MTDITKLSNVAYKKGNWMRYILWGLGAVCVAILILTFVSTINGEISAVVPPGYKFSITDHYIEGSRNRTTYYVYTGKIIAEDESRNDGVVNRAVMIYDGISTDTLIYDEEDTIEICELGTCSAKPKVLAVIKKLISGKIGREYIGL